MSDKPIIAHCRNCIYCDGDAFIFDGYCKVKYKWIRYGRLAAFFCKHFRTHNGLAMLHLRKKDKEIETQVKTIVNKFACDGCSGYCNCFENDSFSKCEYYREHYDWVKSVLVSGSSTGEG